MTIPTPAAARIEAAIKRFASQVARCHDHPGPEEVHDLRVSVRRLQQALELFRKWLPSKPSRKIGAKLDRVLAAAGAVRDCDIALELAGRLGLAVPGALNRARTLRAVNAAGLAKILEPLRTSRLAAKSISALELDPAPSDAGERFARLARKRLTRDAGRFIESGAALASNPGSRRALHSFRISAKRFRYSLEPFEEIYGPAIDKRIATVRKIQTVLGDLNDCVATRKLLKSLGAGADSLAPLRAEEKARLARFQSLWPSLFKSGAAADWTGFLQSEPVHGRGGAARSEKT